MSQVAPTTAAEIVKSTVQAVLEGIESGSLDTVRGRLEVLSAQALVSRPDPNRAAIFKLDPERRMAYGWALVSTVSGQEITDRQGDVVSTDEVRETAHDFIGKRVLGVMHANTSDIGEIRESIVFDAALQKALGIDLGMEGWFVGVYVKHQPTWERVLKGELRSFSIGGTGHRQPILDQPLFKQAKDRVRLASRDFRSGPGRAVLFTDVLAALGE